MIKKNIYLCCMIVVFALSGCAEYWYQEGKTYQQCLQDRQACFEELQKRSDFVGTGDYEFEYMNQCMQEKGYMLVNEGDLPMEARRTRPDSSLHWRAKGIAGEVDQ